MRIKLSNGKLSLLGKKHSLHAAASATDHDASNRYATVRAKLKLLAP